MARFLYLGEGKRPGASERVKNAPALAFRFPKKNGTKFVHLAPDQTKGFPIGQDIGLDITDERTLRHLRIDPRFKEI